MGRVYGERREDGQNVPDEPLPELPPFGGPDLVVGYHAYAHVFEGGHELHVHYPAPLLEELLRVVVDAQELFLRRHPVGDRVRELRGHLLLQPRDPDHEELVQVGLGDRDEAYPLQERMPLVAGLLQDPVVEPQPRELPVYVQRRVREAWPARYVRHITSPLSSASRVPSLIPPRATASSRFPKCSNTVASVVMAAGKTLALSGASPCSLASTPDGCSRISRDRRHNRSAVSPWRVIFKIARAEPPTATTFASPMFHAGKSRPACSRSASSSSSVGGSSRTKRSVVRLVPNGSETRSSGPPRASPRMTCAEPPPRSTTSTFPSWRTAERAPRKPSAASFSPEIRRIFSPVASRTRPTSSSPFSASRTALVASISGEGAPFMAAMLANSVIASVASTRRSSSRRPVFSTPAPSLAETFSPVMGRTAPSFTSPTSRWMVLEPTSTTE